MSVPGPVWLVPDWPAPPTVRAVSTQRGGGTSGPLYASLNLGDHVDDAPAAVAENRRLLRAAAGLPAEPVWLAQVHGTQVKNLDLDPDLDPALDMDLDPALERDPGAAIHGSASADASATTADAAISRRAGRICAILTADCLPILLASETGDRVGAAHAGWRGLAAGVIEATVNALGAPGELLAWLGPAIGPRHFEIGPEVREALLRADPEAHAAFALNARGRFTADLFALARRRLVRAGVERIYGGGVCTYADAARYFSHRRDGRTGRQASLIWLETPTQR